MTWSNRLSMRSADLSGIGLARAAPLIARAIAAQLCPFGDRRWTRAMCAEEVSMWVVSYGTDGCNPAIKWVDLCATLGSDYLLVRLTRHDDYVR
jgi:hypothetical protein